MKICSFCQVEKELTEFSTDKRNSDGRINACKLCMAHKQRERRAAKLNSPPQKANLQKAYRKYRYRLPSDQFKVLLQEQQQACAICKEPFEVTTPCVDHDHACCPGRRACGKCVRGLLCNACNALLGHAKDDPIRLQNAITYLER